MHSNEDNPVEELVHLYVDGAFSRRELVERVSKYAGGLATAAATLTSLGIGTAEAQTVVPNGPQVPEGAPGIITKSVTYAGDGVTLFGYLAIPDPLPPAQSPAVIVIHENRGLVDHIKDVTRRVAVAGFVGLGIDLLSRQGGTDMFTDPVQQQQAYSRTTLDQRRSDMVSSLDYLKHLTYVRFDRIGAVGFCAGGGNVWDLTLILPELAAAVAFYGTPPPPLEFIDLIQAPVLANYAELDRSLSLRMPDVMTAMLTKQKTFAFRLYQGVGHAFHNDTGPAYDAAAATDAWAQTLSWFNKFLRPAAA
jgi:carboxymethylenebutenolidase